VGETTGRAPSQVCGAFFEDRFGGLDDYLGGVDTVFGHSAAFVLRRDVEEAAANTEFSHSLSLPRPDPNEAAAAELLAGMPEPDFRSAMVAGLGPAIRNPEARERVSNICRARGIPWALTMQGFEWTGDEEIERETLRPALSALDDPRLARGARVEFEGARQELNVGTPTALKQAISEAASAVESAMRVVLDQRSISYPPGASASSLFGHLVDEGLVPRHMERLVLAAATPRNKSASHGAGEVAHSVAKEEAQAVVASAAVAISYLATKLP